MDPIAGLVVVLKAAREGTVTTDPYYSALAAAGFRTCLIPVLSFDFFNLNRLWEALKAHKKYSGIVFTSPRAVEGVVLAATRNCGSWKCANPDCLYSWWCQQKVFVVGDATAVAVEETLDLPTQGQEAGNAHILSDIILNALPSGGRPLLFPCGNLKKETLPRKLQNGGISVEAITVYETKAHPQLGDHIRSLMDREGIPEFMVYFSPSGVTYSLPFLMELGFPLGKVKFVAIGPSTAEAVEKAGLEVWGVVTSPTPNSLIETLTHKSHQH